MKLRILKTFLWLLTGAGLTVILMRIIHGPGSVVALTDVLPWGLWKGGGVVALVPIGGAGFTLAAFVYVFHWDRYQPLARGAVLLGLVCYSSVAVGLTFDIGIWWRIVYPLVFWQFHSTLFEIAWCIMLYLVVLVAEFSHAVFEKLNFPRMLALTKKAGIVFVIAGISLSTLHQSSLGTLFLATPYRLHALWLTDLLPLLFFVSAVGLGCLTITWAALVVHWLYGARPPMRALAGLGHIAAWVLGFYLVIKFSEILLSGEGALLLSSGWNTANFWLEVGLSAILPVTLLAFRRYRESPQALFWVSTLALVGMSLNRINVAGLATLDATAATYFPIWPEWLVTLGILALAGLAYLFCIESFDVFPGINKETVKRAYASGRIDHADWKTLFFHNPLSELRLYSLAFVVAAGVTFGSLPNDSVFGVSPLPTPTSRARHLDADTNTDILLVDGNRDGESVLFDHHAHGTRVESQGLGCTWCHHMNQPLDKTTACSVCHTDMYLAVDLFDHPLHADKLGGNVGCQACHRDDSLPKVRKNTSPCKDCHPEMRADRSLVQLTDHALSNRPDGYMHAMHGLCLGCHQKGLDQDPSLGEAHTRCSRCHQHAAEVPGIKELARLKLQEGKEKNAQEENRYRG